MKISSELIAKAKQAKSAQELIALAKQNGTELTEEGAKIYFDQLHKSGELSDEELDNVTGGCGDDEPTDRRVKVWHGHKGCNYYACGICEMKAGCGHRSAKDCTCGNCLHIRYKDDGTTVCNSLNVQDESDTTSVPY